MTSLVLTDVEFASTGGVTTFTFGPHAVAALVDALGPSFATKETSPYMTVDEAAAYIRAPRHRIYGLLSARKLTRHKEGRRTLVRRDELDAYLATQ
jgi:excisionase family DNA binding protein